MTLFHVFSGWDTTSAAYGQGKLPILKLLKKSKGAREEADVFLQKNRTPETIYEAGARILYCGKDSIYWVIWDIWNIVVIVVVMVVVVVVVVVVVMGVALAVAVGVVVVIVVYSDSRTYITDI